MAVTSLVPEDRRDEGHRSSQTSEASFLSKSVARARGSSCPNCKGFYVVSAETGRAFEMSCKGWTCPICSRKRRAVGVELIAGGVERARSRGERIRFVTLTAPPSGMSMSELYCSWNRIRTALKKSGELAQYCAVVELGGEQRPEPHLHALTTGRFIPQERLSDLAQRAGFGRVADIRAVRGTGDRSAVAYVTKQLASQVVGYLMKSELARLAERAEFDGGIAKRAQVRPLRLSRGWYPGGFKAAEKICAQRAAERMGHDGEPSDPGPWYLVIKRWDGELSVVTRPKLAEQGDEDEDGGASASGATMDEDESPAQTSSEAVVAA